MYVVLLRPYLTLIVTIRSEVHYGGSQHLLPDQQEHIMMCNSLLMSEEGVLLMLHSSLKKKLSLVSFRIYLFKEHALLLCDMVTYGTGNCDDFQVTFVMCN